MTKLTAPPIRALRASRTTSAASGGVIDLTNDGTRYDATVVSPLREPHANRELRDPDVSAPASGRTARDAGRGRTTTEGFAASYLNLLVSVGTSFVVTPLFLHGLGSEQYGLWLTVSSWLTYLSLTGAGFPQASQNLVAEAYARRRIADVERGLVTSLWATGVLALGTALLLGGALLTGVVSSRLFHASSATRSAAVPVLALTAGAYLVSLPSEQFRAMLRGVQRVALAQLIVAGGILAAAVAGGVVIAAGGGVVAFAISQAVVTALTAAASVGAGMRTLRREGAKVSIFRVDGRDVQALLSPSLLFLVIALAGVLIWSTDNLIIAAHLGTSQVTPYAVTLRLLTFASSGINALTIALLPSVTALWATARLLDLQRLALRTARAVLALTGLVVVEMLFVGRPFLRLWAGPEAVAPETTFVVFVIVFAVRALAQAMELVVIGISRHKVYAAVALGEGLLNLVLSLILVRHLGLLGVAVGTLVAHLLATGWFLPWWALRSLSLSMRALVGPLTAVLPAAVVTAALGVLLRRVGWGASWAGVAAVALTLAVTYAAVYALTGLSCGERREALLALRRPRSLLSLLFGQ